MYLTKKCCIATFTGWAMVFVNLNVTMNTTFTIWGIAVCPLQWLAQTTFAMITLIAISVWESTVCLTVLVM